MPIHLLILSLFIASQTIVFLMASKLGLTLPGIAAGLAVMSMSSVLFLVLIRTGLLTPLQQLCDTVLKIKTEGNIALRAREAGATRSAAKAFNELLESFESIIVKVMFNSSQVATSAESLETMAQKVTAGSHSQQEAAEAASQAIEEMTHNIQHISEHASNAATNAREARALSSSGAEIAQKAASEIERIAQAFEESASAVNQLGERSQMINGIAHVISDIAEQTNLLALNAAIEAARAGESGRGFAVVADEVRKLAERTTTATQEISSVISSIQSDTASTIGKAQSGSALARHGAGLARQAAEALTSIIASAESMLDKSDSIANAISEQTVASELVGQKMHNIVTLVEQNSDVVAKVLHEATHLDHLAVNLKELDAVFKIGETGIKGLQTHGKVPALVQAAARDIARTLEQAMASHRISESDLFDENYVRIPGTEPAKYHTRFDKLTDELFPAIQEALLDRNPEFIYAGAVDRNGYFPTHNKKFSAAPTGDIKHDTLYSRTKRIFTDPVGKRCGNHGMPFLIQTYRRDTGEVMHDISTPIRVNGKPWGGFRIGYRA